MKKRITAMNLLVTGAVCVLLLAYGFKNRSEKAEGYTITGYIAGLEGKESRIYLDRSSFFKDDIEKSAVIKDGKFEIKGVVQAPEMRYLSIKGCKGYLPIFLDNTAYTVKGSCAELEFSDVKGGAIQEEYRRYDVFLRKYQPQFQKLKESFKATTNKDTLTEIERKYKILSAESSAIYERDFPNNPKSYLTSYLLYDEFKNEDIKRLDSIIRFFDPSIMNSPYVVALKKRIETLKGVSVGKQAIDFTAEDINGKQVKLSSFYGKFLLVDFWASWCHPCRIEANTLLVPLYKEFHDQGFDILGVSIDSQLALWKNALEEEKMTWNQVLCLNGFQTVGKIYGIEAIPSNVLLDSDGKIIARDIHGEKLKQKIAEIVKSKTK